MTVELDDPAAYGRIVRDESGDIERIVETKRPEEVETEVLAIREINTGTYVFAAQPLVEALDRLDNDNAAGEYYIGDVLPMLRDQGLRVVAHMASDPNVNLGVNDRVDLAQAAAEARRQILERHMLAGVTIVDPEATWIDADVEIAADATIEPGTTLRGRTTIGADSIVGPHSTLIDTRVGSGARVLHSHLVRPRSAILPTSGRSPTCAPTRRWPPAPRRAASSRSRTRSVGEGAKVPHLSYVGDTDVGPGANLGAGSITANYDGRRKHRTKIGQGARISVNTSLVAPVSIGDRAYTGAGAVIREDVPDGALGVSSNEQRNIDDYAERKSAEANEESGGTD